MIKNCQLWVTPLVKCKTLWLILFSHIIFVSVVSAQASEEKLQGFEAEYNAYRFGKKLGTANLSLKEADNHQYQLDYSSKVSIFFLSDVRTEHSIFSVKESQLLPKLYQYKRTGTGSTKQTGIEFFVDAKKVKVNNREPIDWSNQLDNQLYRLDTQLKLAAGETHFNYDIINSRGDLRHYDLKVVGKETLDLPYGKVESVKVKIDRSNSSRETIIWFAPELNYQLVKLKQFKDGDEQGEIQLKSFKLIK